MSATTLTRSVTIDAPAVGRFRRELGSLWPEVRPMCDDSASDDDATLLQTYRATRARSDRVVPGDLEALLVGWSHYSADEKAVLRGAVHYVADTPTMHDGGPDEVVGAAVRALIRRR